MSSSEPFEEFFVGRMFVKTAWLDLPLCNQLKDLSVVGRWRCVSLSLSFMLSHSFDSLAMSHQYVYLGNRAR